AGTHGSCTPTIGARQGWLTSLCDINRCKDSWGRGIDVGHGGQSTEGAGVESLTHRDEVSLHGHRVSMRHGGEGPPIVLIHGITGSAEQWTPVMESLASDYTVLAPDLLGHGESAKPRGDYSL